MKENWYCHGLANFQKNGSLFESNNDYYVSFNNWTNHKVLDKTKQKHHETIIKDEVGKKKLKKEIVKEEMQQKQVKQENYISEFI